MIIIKRFIFILYFLMLLSFCFYQLFLPLYQSEEIIISFGLHPSDICYDNPLFWKYLKTSFIFFYLFFNFIIINSLILRLQIFNKKDSKNTPPIIESSNLQLLNFCIRILLIHFLSATLI